MIAAAPPAMAVACVTCLLLAGALVAVRSALAPARVAAARSGSTPSMFTGIGRNRMAVGAAAGVLVLLATRWFFLALLVGLMVVLWGRLLHDDRAQAERVRIEGIAKWLEDLRDTLRGSSVGAEEALEQVAMRAPDSIAGPLRRFAQRRRQGFRTEDALADLADDLAHPTSDAAIAALRLVVGGSTSAGRLYGTVDALAAAARDELTARERIDRTRAIYQSSMKRLVIIGAVLVAYLRFAGGDLLRPYDSPMGQVVLLLPLGMWVGCVLWLRSLCRYDLPARYRLVGAVEPVR
jgi:hypothetical protein